LIESSRRFAAAIIFSPTGAYDRMDAVLLTADFNASPDASSRQLLHSAGWQVCAAWVGRPPGTPTDRFDGIALWCLDGILRDRKWKKWKVPYDHVLAMKPADLSPSDHFGPLADLMLAGQQFQLRKLPTSAPRPFSMASWIGSTAPPQHRKS